VRAIDSARLRERRVSWRRLLAGGLAAAAIAAAIGAASELWRFGASDSSAAEEVERYVRGEFDRMTADLSRVATAVGSDPAAVAGLSAAADGARGLFDLLDRRVSGEETARIAVTIYTEAGDARAWIGRPSDIDVTNVRPFFVLQSPLGLRLVHVPLRERHDPRKRALAAPRLPSRTPTDVLDAARPVAAMRWKVPAIVPARTRLVADPLVRRSSNLGERRDTAGRAHRPALALAITTAIVSLTLLLQIGPLLIAAHPRAVSAAGRRLEPLRLCWRVPPASGRLQSSSRRGVHRQASSCCSPGGARGGLRLLAGPIGRLRLVARDAAQRNPAHERSPRSARRRRRARGHVVTSSACCSRRRPGDGRPAPLRSIRGPWQLPLLCSILACHAAGCAARCADRGPRAAAAGRQQASRRDARALAAAVGRRCSSPARAAGRSRRRDAGVGWRVRGVALIGHASSSGTATPPSRRAS
jgi:hypothetical protein